MNKKFLLILILTFLFTNLLLHSKVFSQEKFNFYKIHEIKEKKLNPGFYNTEGYVSKIYVCPPCPKNAMCKPCMRNNIVISEDNDTVKLYKLTNYEMIIFTEKSKLFKIGRKYRFLIKITDNCSTFEPINDVELVKYKII